MECVAGKLHVTAMECIKLVGANGTFEDATLLAGAGPRAYDGSGRKLTSFSTDLACPWSLVVSVQTAAEDAVLLSHIQDESVSTGRDRLLGLSAGFPCGDRPATQG